MQLNLDEFPLKKCYCPISNVIFLSRFEHDKQCIYYYCKERRWLWSKGLI